MAQPDLDERRKARPINFAAYALIVAALALPLTVASPQVDRMTAGRAGELLAEMLLALLLVLVVLFIALRRRSKIVQAHARLAVGASVLLCAGAACFTSWHGQETFARDVIDLNRRTVKAFTDLNKQFTALDVSTLLTPQHLTDHAGIDASRATLREFTKLVNERDAVIDRYFKNREALFRTANIDEATRQAALQTFHEFTPKTEKTLEDFSAAQHDWADAVSAVLDFADANLGRHAVQDGQLMFPDQASLGQYRTLLSRVDAAGQRSRQAQQATRGMLALSTSDIR
jgi:hypothetical protein